MSLRSVFLRNIPKFQDSCSSGRVKYEYLERQQLTCCWRTAVQVVCELQMLITRQCVSDIGYISEKQNVASAPHCTLNGRYSTIESGIRILLSYLDSTRTILLDDVKSRSLIFFWDKESSGTVSFKYVTNWHEIISLHLNSNVPRFWLVTYLSNSNIKKKTLIAFKI